MTLHVNLPNILLIAYLLASLLACLLGWADHRTRPRIITPNHKIAKSPHKSNYFQFMGWYRVQVVCSSYLIVFLMRFFWLTTFNSTAIFAKQSEWFPLPPMKSTRWLTHKNYLIIMRISAFSHSISSICRLSFSYSTFLLFYFFYFFLSPFIFFISSAVCFCVRAHLSRATILHLLENKRWH